MFGGLQQTVEKPYLFFSGNQVQMRLGCCSPALRSFRCRLIRYGNLSKSIGTTEIGFRWRGQQHTIWGSMAQEEVAIIDLCCIRWSVRTQTIEKRKSI